MVLDKGKGKRLPNKSRWLRYKSECLTFTFTLAFGTIVTAELSTVRAYSVLPAGKLIRALFLQRVDAPHGY